VGEGGGGAEEGEIARAGEGGMAVHAGSGGLQSGEDEEPDGGGDCLRSAETAFRRPSNGRWKASRKPAERVSIPSTEAEIEKRTNFRLSRGDFSATC